MPAFERQGDARGIRRGAGQPLRCDAHGDRLPNRRGAGPYQAEATSKAFLPSWARSPPPCERSSVSRCPRFADSTYPIEQATTPSLAALKAYTLGQEERRRGRELESVAFFNQAIENDREFAAAYITLSTVYGSLGEWRRSEEFAKRANAVTRPLSERERLLIAYQCPDRVTGNQALAAEALELWKAAYPRDFRPANALAVIYNRTGRYDRAVAEAQEALRRSPGHPFPLSNLAFAFRALGRDADARRTAEEAVKLGVETTPTASPLSVGPRRRRRLAALAGLGEEQTTRSSIWCPRRRRLPPSRVDFETLAPSINTRSTSRWPEAERNGIRLRGAPRLDRGPLP